MAFSWIRTAPAVKKKYTQYSDDFYLNADGLLVKKDIPRDDQAFIDADFGTRLEAILDIYSDQIDSLYASPRFSFSEEVVEVDHAKGDLESILRADEAIASYQAQYPELKGKSRSEVIKFAQKRYNGLVEEYNKKKTENIEKEIPKDETSETQSQSES